MPPTLPARLRYGHSAGGKVRRRSIKPCRPHPVGHTAPRKRFVLIVTESVRFRRYRNRMIPPAEHTPPLPKNGVWKTGDSIFAGVAGGAQMQRYWRSGPIRSDYHYSTMRKFVNYFSWIFSKNRGFYRKNPEKWPKSILFLKNALKTAGILCISGVIFEDSEKKKKRKITKKKNKKDPCFLQKDMVK